MGQVRMQHHGFPAAGLVGHGDGCADCFSRPDHGTGRHDQGELGRAQGSPHGGDQQKGKATDAPASGRADLSIVHGPGIAVRRETHAVRFLSEVLRRPSGFSPNAYTFGHEALSAATLRGNSNI
jgi:hypothetical protein